MGTTKYNTVEQIIFNKDTIEKEFNIPMEAIHIYKCHGAEFNVYINNKPIVLKNNSSDINFKIEDIQINSLKIEKINRGGGYVDIPVFECLLYK